MNEMQMAPAGWKKKIVHEVIEYWINFGYLAFFLVAFIWYRRLVLAAYQVQYTNYWLARDRIELPSREIAADVVRCARRWCRSNSIAVVRVVICMWTQLIRDRSATRYAIVVIALVAGQLPGAVPGRSPRRKGRAHKKGPGFKAGME
jgi:hypothetical protein